MSRARLIVAAIALAGLIAAVWLLPLGRWALILVEQVRDAGSIGALIYGGVYVLATLLLIPGSLLTIGAGFLYGLAGGMAVVWPSSVLGATLSFLLGRSVARDWVGRKLAGRHRVVAVDEAVAERGFAIVFLLRLSPLFPFGLLNYTLALTRARARDYVIATALGMIPGIFLYVYIGTLVTSIAALAAGERPDAGVAQHALFWGGLVATAAVTVWVSRLARKRLDRAL